MKSRKIGAKVSFEAKQKVLGIGLGIGADWNKKLFQLS